MHNFQIVCIYYRMFMHKCQRFLSYLFKIPLFSYIRTVNMVIFTNKQCIFSHFMQFIRISTTHLNARHLHSLQYFFAGYIADSIELCIVFVYNVITKVSDTKITLTERYGTYFVHTAGVLCFFCRIFIRYGFFIGGYYEQSCCYEHYCRKK